MTRFPHVLIVTLTGLMLAGCSETPRPATDDAVVADSDTAAAPAETRIKTRPVPGDSIGKPTVPVRLDYEFLAPPAVGEPLTIRLSIAGRDVSGLSLALSTRGNLGLSKNAPTQVALKTGTADAAPVFHDAVVTAGAEGRSYLNVQITGIYESQPFTKAMSIPVQVGVGGPVLKTNGEIIDDGVEVLSSMPAQQQVQETDSER